MLGMILEAQKKLPDEQKMYERALESDPSAPVAANNLAWIYSNSGTNLDIALQLAQTAKQMLPDEADINDTLGWIYYKKGLAALAIAPLEQSVGASPGNVVYRYHLGLAYAKSGDTAKARAAFAEVVRLKPDAPEAGDAKKALAAL